jgi:hypothetical protein
MRCPASNTTVFPLRSADAGAPAATIQRLSDAIEFAASLIYLCGGARSMSDPEE